LKKGGFMSTSYLKQFAERRQKKKIQFPPEVTGPVTIFPRRTDNLTGNQTNVTAVLQGCFWDSDSISNFIRTGQQTINNATIFIPYSAEVTGRTYLTPEEWNALPNDAPDVYWTVDPKNLPILIAGINLHEFSWASPNASNRITIQENNFLNLNPTAKRIIEVNVQNFGPLDMWHIVLRG